MNGQALDDLGFELRMLVGADQVVAFMEADGRLGNLVNYFKDSAYLHARNLLNALTNAYPTEIGLVPASIKSELYGKVKDSLERYVMHIKKPRNGRGAPNIRDGKHLNERIHELTAEVRRCWGEWADSTPNAANKQRLQDILAAADEQAQNDCSQLKGLLK